MNEVKVYCETCFGAGVFDNEVTVYKCDKCSGKGYTLQSWFELAHDYKITLDPPHDAHFSVNEPMPYDITDAQADAAVLEALKNGDRWFKNLQESGDVACAIIDRLHAFYCGEGEK